ncbi:MAG TPA: hypothetical protein VGJ20_13535 [Xanthobacteraceae bacterium]
MKSVEVNGNGKVFVALKVNEDHLFCRLSISAFSKEAKAGSIH